MIGQVEEFRGLKFAFEANGIQSHVADVTEFIVQALRIFAQHQVGRPAAAANQNILSEMCIRDRIRGGHEASRT